MKKIYTKECVVDADKLDPHDWLIQQGLLGVNDRTSVRFVDEYNEDSSLILFGNSICYLIGSYSRSYEVYEMSRLEALELIKKRTQLLFRELD